MFGIFIVHFCNVAQVVIPAYVVFIVLLVTDALITIDLSESGVEII